MRTPCTAPCKFALLALVLATQACGYTVPDDGEWDLLFEDENQVVYFAAGNMELQPGGWYSVWYRTQHQQPRTHEGRVWHTETTRSLLRCDGLWFKVAEVRLRDDQQVVSVQRASNRELDLQRWRPVSRGTPEEDVAQLACDRVSSRNR